MRNFLLLSLFLCFFGITRGQGIVFFQGSFQEALVEAKKQDKILFVDVYAEWCEPCQVMAQQVFPLEQVGNYFNEKFVSYKLNVNSPENKSIVQKYQIKGLPTLLFLDGDGKVVHQYMGVTPPELLLRQGRVATNEQKTLDELYKMYKKNKTDLDIHRMILSEAPYFMQEIERSQQEKWTQRLKSLYQEYLNDKGLEKMITREDFNIFTLFHDRMDKQDDVVDFIVSHYDQYVAIVGIQAVTEYLTRLHSSCVIELARAGDQDYLNVLKRMTGDMYPVYVYFFPDTEKYKEMYRILADANYAIYHEKNSGRYIELMDSFLVLQESPQSNDYAMVVETMFNGLKGKLPKEGYEKCLLWLDAALKGKVPEEMQVMIVTTVGDCFLGLKDQIKAKESYNQAYLLSLRLQNQQFAMQMQQALKQKLSQLDED